MVLEADRRGCAEEVIVIVAALSIQDPRERPAEKREQADQLHARFEDESSDFIAYVNLWRYLREQQLALSGNQFRKRCHAEFLHHLRVREWQDLVAQLRQAAKGMKLTLNRQPAEPESIHVALVAGLLSQLGLKDPAKREYQGARGARFAIFPGSALARKQPSWVMVAELVETSRLWGRTAARLDPRWVEPLAGHLIKRSYDEPHWERKRASVVASERATLYGLPIVAGRKVAYGRIDPELSRSLFIRRALVEGDWDTRHAFFAANRELLDEVEELESRARRRDIRVDDQALYDFYDARIPADVVSGGHFDRWWREERQREPGRLTFTRADVVTDDSDALDRRALPEAWRQGEMTMPLSYVFDPGAERDGVTLHVPLKWLPQLQPIGFDWLVPALRPELVTALIRSLPKELRRTLVPVPELAEAALARMRPRSEPLLDALAGAIEALRGVRIPRDAWAVDRLPPHLRMTFRIEDERGALVAEGSDLDALREQARPRLRQELATAAASLERHGLTGWTIGTLPQTVALPGTGQSVRGYPALVDEGAAVAVRVLETPEAQRAAMRTGTRKLIAMNVPSPIRGLRGTLSNAAPARAGRRAACRRARRAGGRDARRARRADRGRRRPGVGRGRLHPAARPRRRPPRRRDRAGGPRRRRGPRRRARGRARARADRPRRRRSRPRATTSSASSAGSCTPASSPPPAPAGCRTSSATCAPPPAAWSACRTLPVRTSIACAGSRSSSASTRRGSRPLPRGSRSRRRWPRSRGCWRSSACRISRRRSAPAGRSRRSGSAR